MKSVALRDDGLKQEEAETMPGSVIYRETISMGEIKDEGKKAVEFYSRTAYAPLIHQSKLTKGLILFGCQSAFLWASLS